jgi:transposase
VPRGAAPTPHDPAELVADKGYHSREGLKDLEDGAWKSRIAEKKASGVSRWRGDDEARRAVYNNRARLRSGVAREAFKLRAELCERGFALVLDRGGMRRAGPGCAGGRTCASATSCTWPVTTSAWSCAS